MIRARYGPEAAQAVLGHGAADVAQVYAGRDLAKGAIMPSGTHHSRSVQDTSLGGRPEQVPELVEVGY
jgi:hypothetical protein